MKFPSDIKANYLHQHRTYMLHFIKFICNVVPLQQIKHKLLGIDNPAYLALHEEDRVTQSGCLRLTLHPIKKKDAYLFHSVTYGNSSRNNKNQNRSSELEIN